MSPGPDPTRWQVGLVGYGEVGKILAEDLRDRGVEVSAYDIKLDAVPPARRCASTPASTG